MIITIVKISIKIFLKNYGGCVGSGRASHKIWLEFFIKKRRKKEEMWCFFLTYTELTVRPGHFQV